VPCTDRVEGNGRRAARPWRATALVALAVLTASCGSRTGLEPDITQDAATIDSGAPPDAPLDQTTADSGEAPETSLDAATLDVSIPDALADAPADVTQDSAPDGALDGAPDSAPDATPDSGCGTVGYDPGILLPIGCFAATIAIADVDRDGLPDLLVTDESSSSSIDSLGVLRNLGGRKFAPEISYPAGGEPRALAVVDMNGDGWPDMVTANYFNSSIGVLFNDRTGKVGPQTPYPAGNGPDGGPDWVWTLAVGDLDGDKLPDVVVAEQDLFTQTGGGIGVRLNVGGGTLGPEVIYPNSVLAGTMGGSPRRGPTSVAIADLNGDGSNDIAITNTDEHAAVYLNQGNGTFAPETLYAIGNEGPSGDINCQIAIGDLGNGRPDLAVTNTIGPALGMLPNTGSGTFGPESTIPAVGSGPLLALADLDRNGLLDVVTASIPGGPQGISVVLDQGGGVFGMPTSYPTTTGAFIEALAVGDIDGDGLPDLAVADEDNCEIEVLFARCQ
jgi:hypothetical protein